jgi:ribonuclease HI
MSYYAVRCGKNPGIYTCWDECRKQVSGVKGAVYKKFTDKTKAETFCKDKSTTYSNKSIKRTKLPKKYIEKKRTKEKKEDTIYIFTDGSSINNGAKDSKAGFGIYIPEPENIRVKISVKLPKGKTNNYAELKAILEALKIIDNSNIKNNDKRYITIVTDSQYSINCITQWYNSWVKRGWVSTTGKEVKNKELIQEIKPLCIKHTVKFQHIKAHTSNKGFFYEGNRIVDKLANGTEV